MPGSSGAFGVVHGYQRRARGGAQRGHCPIFEPGLAPLLEKNLACGRLRFTTDAAEAVQYARLQFIAVGTPPQADGNADTRYVFSVIDSILEHADDPKVIVNKSTSPVGTVDRIKARISQAVADAERYQVISNPEFLKEGSAVDDCMRPDRIIIGGAEPAEVELLRELYQPFSRNRENHGHGRAQRRADQVRRQLHAGNQDFLHQ